MTTGLGRKGRDLRSRPSLWLHGGGLSGDTWRHILTDLPHAVAPDLPGHGGADAPKGPSVEAYADALLPHLEKGMVVIGHSIGGMVALELAARSTVPLGALVMIEAVPTVRDRWSGRIGLRLARPILRRLPPKLLAEISCLGQSPATRAEIRRTIARQNSQQVIDVFDAARTYDGRRHLPSLTLPTLILVGRKNRATHRGARLAARRNPGADFAMLEGGHLLHIDNPDGLRRSIDGFLRRLPPPELDRGSWSTDEEITAKRPDP